VAQAGGGLLNSNNTASRTSAHLPLRVAGEDFHHAFRRPLCQDGFLLGSARLALVGTTLPSKR